MYILIKIKQFFIKQFFHLTPSLLYCYIKRSAILLLHYLLVSQSIRIIINDNILIIYTWKIYFIIQRMGPFHSTAIILSKLFWIMLVAKLYASFCRGVVLKLYHPPNRKRTFYLCFNEHLKYGLSALSSSSLYFFFPLNSNSYQETVISAVRLPEKRLSELCHLFELGETLAYKLQKM